MIWLGGAWITGAAVVSTVIALRELYRLFSHTGYRPRRIGYLCAVLFVLVAALQTQFQATLLGFVLLFSFVAPLLGEFPRRQREGSLVAWALTFTGAVYVGWTIAHFILLRHVEHPLLTAPLQILHLDAGTAWILMGLLLTFANDSLAYFVGRAWGRHRMAPYISPKKSWEGAIGGLIGSIVTAVLLVPLLGLPISLWMGALLGLAGGAAGQIGDLGESLLKRQVGVKDSGHIIPGHGGLLDRADSLLFTIPTLYYLVRWLTG
jgi:phosphatidate cytidylyltransferase